MINCVDGGPAEFDAVPLARPPAIAGQSSGFDDAQIATYVVVNRRSDRGRKVPYERRPGRF
ncbi:MAG: hypothetical protein ACREM2_00055 [Vulcanimicrobiaceae bacterium]